MAGLRIYQIYFSGAAAEGVASVPIVRKGEIVGIAWAQYSAVGQGHVAELSLSPKRQYGSNDTQGIVSLCAHSNAATGPEQLHTNLFVALPPGCGVAVGDKIYLHSTQAGSAASAIQTAATVYVRES